MKKRFKDLSLLILALALFSCEKQAVLDTDNSISREVIDQLQQLGFNPDGIRRTEDGYLIERDIVITEEFLRQNKQSVHVPNLEQYHTDNLVSTNGSRNIVVYMNTKGKSGFSNFYVNALDEAIARYNAENLEVTFSRTTNKRGADISFKRLSAFEELIGVLGSAGFPSANGNPYGQISLNGSLQGSISVNGMATIIAHEMGHCIGLRHTDYFDRSISCGGSTDDEGDGGVGANHIPGTPTGATLNAKSYMLSCTDGSNRPFNNDDQTALDYLY